MEMGIGILYLLLLDENHSSDRVGDQAMSEIIDPTL